MKLLFPPALVLLFPLLAPAEIPESQSMVGVLMDASCPAIAEGSRHTETPPVLTAARETKRPRTPLKAGTRSRAVTSKSTDDGDRYDTCKATASTTDFAIHTDGQLLVLDEEGNDLVRQQMRNDSFRASMSDESGAPRWLTVMVEGRKTGERLTITSLRR